MAACHDYLEGKHLGMDKTLRFNALSTLHCNDVSRHGGKRSPIRVSLYSAHRLHASELHAAEHPKLCDSMAAHHWHAC